MSKIAYAILFLLLGFLIGWFVFGYLNVSGDTNIDAYGFTQNVCDEGKYCDSWSRGICVDWDYKICHINPAQNVQHDFNTYGACLGHIGTPHNDQVHDLAGDCPVVTPTPTLTPTPTPKPPDDPPVCETEAWSCEACQNDPREYEKRLGVCFEPFASFCNKNFGCEFVGDCEKSLFECQSEWICKDTCEEPEPTLTPTPTPTPTEEPKKPEGCTENCNPPAPVCSAETVVNMPANPHVYRLNGTALVKWNATGGNKANVYYKECSAADWQHSVQTDNTGYVEIHELGNMDVCFAIEQVNDCGGGVITAARSETIVDGATGSWVLFR